MRKIYFDEAGYSGNNLLDNSQPLYCYLGIEDVDGKLKEKFLNLKNLHRYKTDLEIKGANLSKSVKGQKFLIDLWNTFGNECKFVLLSEDNISTSSIFFQMAFVALINLETESSGILFLVFAFSRFIFIRKAANKIKIPIMHLSKIICKVFDSSNNLKIFFI